MNKRKRITQRSRAVHHGTHNARDKIDDSGEDAVHESHAARPAKRMRAESTLHRIRIAAGEGDLEALALACREADSLGVDRHALAAAERKAARKAAFRDFPACLAFMHEARGVALDPSLYELAAWNRSGDGNLRYLRAHGCRWSSQATNDAARAGNLAGLIYLREQGCPWGHGTCFYAASEGRLACLRYAHRHGAPWGSDVVRAAARGGHRACVAYLLVNGCPCDGAEACAAAAKCGRLECLRYLREKGCAWDRGATLAAAHGNALIAPDFALLDTLPCLEYLLSAGCPADARACQLAAAAAGRADCLELLRSEQDSACDRAELLAAVEDGLALVMSIDRQDACGGYSEGTRAPLAELARRLGRCRSWVEGNL